MFGSRVSLAVENYRKVVLGIVLLAGATLFGLTVRAEFGAAAIGAMMPAAGLAEFRSDADLRTFLLRVRAHRARENRALFDVAPPGITGGDDMLMEMPAAQPQQPGITNTQEVGVDEGGIVKTWRDMLVILRRGRLFTVSLAGGAMRPIDSIDAFPPGVSGEGDWYDEMLVAGDRVIVIGYSYARGGTEVNRFRISPDGRLRFEDAYHLRSNDYYSSRNYASRLIGTRLIYYTPLYLGPEGDPLDSLPGLRKWEGRGQGAFRRIGEARRVYIAPALRRRGGEGVTALHSIVSCNLAATELDCDATAVLGPESRTFYVSPSAVYLWIAGDADDGPQAFVYRLPLDGSRPAAVGTRGMPADQFSFREDRDGLNVLVRAEGGGDAMGRPEMTEGAVSLLQLPFSDFGDGSAQARASRYRNLPHPGPGAWNFQNRFVGNYVLYGGGAFGGGRPGRLHAAALRGRSAFSLPLAHAVERIEALGEDALVVGSARGDLGFTSIALGERPAVGSLYVQQGAAQGENRSHAFFFRPDPDSPAGTNGIMGLPVTRPVEPAYHRFFGSAAAMLFLRRRERAFSAAGELAANVASTADDGCQASCADWYGNARPIFWRGRVFALLGYELVEGRLMDGRIGELNRISFAPRASIAARGAGS